ncbi:hypothetical protein I7I48_02742 [Histoplasma ohiense]|nr:hypothetical protein I7I48_02742 [Histoplasma ohiense (nom. inval.)]
MKKMMVVEEVRGIRNNFNEGMGVGMGFDGITRQDLYIISRTATWCFVFWVFVARGFVGISTEYHSHQYKQCLRPLDSYNDPLGIPFDRGEKLAETSTT